MSEPRTHRVARDFDGFRDGKPNFTDRARIEEGVEKESLLAYLKAGRSLFRTTWLGPDLLDESRGKAVPITYRTDGLWMWTDAVPYYLEVHGISPEPELVTHIRSGGGKLPEVSDESLRSAAEFLRKFFKETPVAYKYS